MVEQEQKTKDMIIVAQEGHQVLLDIDGRTLSIDCHECVNLSNMFPTDVIERCASLNTSLKLGNLVRCAEDTELTEDKVSPTTIQTLRPETASHIAAQYTQTERDVKRTNMEMQTQSDITVETRRHIEEQVQASKEKIHQMDHKFLTKKKDTVDPDAMPSLERQEAMTSDELAMNVTMDIPADDFNERQQEEKQQLEASEDADEARAEAEIAKQDAIE